MTTSKKMRFHCAQRGCVSVRATQPKLCPVCRNPWFGVVEDIPDDAPDGGDNDVGEDANGDDAAPDTDPSE